ncbi:MAG: dTDP-4-dehydrorhamnose 3,5-epimerase [Holophagales bacterium]|nr:MAG: dTDP-4-dehydrorhamnose 3,5-epimerase [Holophagales bacterium]
MKFTPTEVPEIVLVEPDVFRDERGFFLEVFHERRWAAEAGLTLRLVQDNHSRSRAGTLRGLHAQLRRPQGKLVRCTRGEIFDVGVDIRRGSPTFGRWAGAILSEDNFRLLWVPEGFAHGFCVLSEAAEVQYKVTEFYDPGGEIGIAWNDPRIGIDWPIAAPLLSPRDAAAPRLDEILDRLPVFPAVGVPETAS